MKRWILVLMASLLLLVTACGQQGQPQTDEAKQDSEEALFDESMLSSAVLELADEESSLEAQDGERIHDTQDITLDEAASEAMLQDQGELATQAVLPNASGFVYYIQRVPNAARPYRLWRYDQATNVRRLLFATTRPLQSVAGDATGNTVIFAYREAAGDYEIFQLDISKRRIKRLTRNNVHDTNVSMSADTQRKVWETTRNSKRVVSIRTSRGLGSHQMYLRSNHHMVQPSISANGRFVTMVRRSTPNRILRFDISARAFSTVYVSNVRLYHPSPSDTGRLVAFQEGSARVRLKNLGTGVTRTVAASGSGVSHPHLKADGRWLSYGRKRAGAWNVVTMNLAAPAAVWSTANPLPNANFAPYWQGDAGRPDLVVHRASIALGDSCKPYNAALKVTATVGNIGTGMSPERNDVGLVNALDNHGNGWGNGTGLPALYPGQSATVTFPIYYLISDPEHMIGTHEFDVRANRGNWIAESDTSNNSHPPVSVTVPADFCDFGDPRHGRSWGDPHQLTFDQLAYEFQAVGAFTLLQTPANDLSVQVCEKPWGSSNRVSVNSAVATMLAGSRVAFYAGAPMKVNGVDTPLADGATLNIGAGQVKRQGNVYTVLYPSGDEMKVQNNGGYLNIDAYVPPARFGKISGLFGNANGDKSDDIALKDGTVLAQPISFSDMYGQYANSWRVSDADSYFAADGYACPADLSFPNLQATPQDADAATRANAEAVCAAAGVTDPTILRQCIIDVINTGETSFADAAADTPAPEDTLVVNFDLPNPVLSYEGWEEYEANGKDWVRFKLDVTNWNEYPNALFDPAPHLPPCGANANSSRAWVDIYEAGTNTRLYGFCALGQSTNLQDLWFAVEKGQIPAQAVYIEITDRQTGEKYRSNPVRIYYTTITNYTLRLGERAKLEFGDRAYVGFKYFTNESPNLRIFVRPMTGGALTPNYAAHGSPLHPATTGAGAGYFTIQSGVAPVKVDQIRIQVLNGNMTKVLHETFIDVDYSFNP